MSDDLDKILEKIKNRPLTTLNLEEYLSKEKVVVFDLKDNLFKGLILREKDFRIFIKEHNWEQYQDKNIAITCSADAIVPQWAFMLVAVKLEPFVKKMIFGTAKELEKELFIKNIEAIDVERFRDAKLVVKGCGDVAIPTYAYVEITRLLRPVVFSLFYGEPCSTVPLYKRKKT